MTIFWDISKQNRGQKKWDGGSISYTNKIIVKKKLKMCLVEWILGRMEKRKKEGNEKEKKFPNMFDWVYLWVENW